MTIWVPEDDGQADLGSHDSFASGAPYNTFARLRREDPCHWSDFDGGKGYWSITRHADIAEMIRDVETFSSAPQQISGVLASPPHSNVVSSRIGVDMDEAPVVVAKTLCAAAKLLPSPVR